MKIIEVVLLLLQAAGFLCRVGGAAVEWQHSEKSPQIDNRNGKDFLSSGNIVDENYDYDYDYGDVEDEDETTSGDYHIELPRVAFSSKPKDLSVPLPLEQDRKPKGKGRKKGKGKKRDPCLRKFKDFCIHGECRYLRELRAPSCICEEGFIGERCHLFSLPVVNNRNSYDRTTALAVVAVVLSSLCLIVIAALLTLRFHKRGEYDVENEEKVKLGSATNQL